MDETRKTDTSASNDGTTRRTFLKQAGVATAGVLVTGMARRSAYALAPGRVIGANDRIKIGHIGCGGQGGTHIRLLKEQASDQNIQSIAVCDIYDRRLNGSKEATGGQAYHDYRKLLDNKDVDAVWIATPEHWHAKMAIDSRTRSVSSRVANWSRNAPVETGVVSVHRAGRSSKRRTSMPARAAW